MKPSDERPQEPSPQPATEPVRLEAHASGQAHIQQAGRDLHQHYEAGVHSGHRAEPGTATSICPYPGLAAFGPEYARWFFGRGELTKALISHLGERLRTGGVQAVVAPSGAGKSSLLQAGLLPELADDALPGSSRWATMVFTPTAQPLWALATQIAALTHSDSAAVASTLASDPQRGVAILGAALRGRSDGGGSRTQLVMVVDQFEELFTLCTDERQRRAFVELLAQLAAPGPKTGTDTRPVGLVVVGVRADFYPACVNYPQLRTALEDNPLAVGPMSDTQLREVILHPARDVGLTIEPGLVELVLRDLGDTTLTAEIGGIAGNGVGRLPLLAHSLRATWQQRHGHTLTVHSYQATGGIHHAVATTAEQVFAALDADCQAVARILFLRLITVGDGTEDTRRRVPRSDLLRDMDPHNALPVLDEFTQGRLLTQDQDTVEITHEALLRAWPRLRQWIDTDRAGNLTRQELENATIAWDRNRRDASVLYRGRRLTAATEWAARHRDDLQLSPRAHEFLAASARREHNAARLRRAVLVVLSVLALLTSTGAIVAIQQNGIARSERDNALFNQITAVADRLRSTDASLAAQLDFTAHTKRRDDQNVWAALLSSQNTPLATPLNGHNDSVRSVAFSPDGRILASAGQDDTVRLWDITDPTRPAFLSQLTDHKGDVNSVAFSPNGQILASGSADHTVRLWNVSDPKNPTPDALLDNQDREVTSVVFSRDGRLLASAGGNPDRDYAKIQLWDLDGPTPNPLGQLPISHAGPSNSVAFSPDSRTLASSGSDKSHGNTVQLWNITDPSNPSPWGQPLTGFGDEKIVISVAFSPDGSILASAGYDFKMLLWKVTDPAQSHMLGELVINPDGAAIASFAFSRDGKTLASADTDREVRLWNLTDPTDPSPLGQPLTGHTNFVWSVAFSPDGRTLASGGADHTVRLWDLPDTLLTGHTDCITSVAFSSDKRTLATSSCDETVRLWDVTDPANPRTLGQPLRHKGPVWAVAFSPDGRRLASGGQDKDGETVRLWDVSEPTQPGALGQPLNHPGFVRSVTFSPDGRTLASAGDDHTIRLWDVTEPANPGVLGAPLTGHEKRVWAVAFSPDGDTLASASGDHTVRLWNVTDPAKASALGQPLTQHIDSVELVAFSPDGKTLASASSDHTARLWDVADPANPISRGDPLTGHTGIVNSVVFSPTDKPILATASADNTVRLWDLADPANPTPMGGPLTGHVSTVFSVAFSPDGETLASVDYYGTIFLWKMEMDLNQAIERICNTTRNTLTPKAWKQYVSENVAYNPPCPS